MARDWLQRIRLDWAQLKNLCAEYSQHEEMLVKHSSLFQLGLGKISGTTAKLYLKPGAKPKFCRAQTLPIAVCEKIKWEIAHQVEEGILEPVNFLEWATTVVPLIKKDGSVWLCGDYKVTVNHTSETESYPLLKIDVILGSKLDLPQCHAYQQIVLDDESKKVVTINTHRGLYQENYLPFRVATSPSMFQRIMESILQGLWYISVHRWHPRDWENTKRTLRNLDAVLTRFEEVDLRFKQEKCVFSQPVVEYLGYSLCFRGPLHCTKQSWCPLASVH